MSPARAAGRRARKRGRRKAPAHELRARVATREPCLGERRAAARVVDDLSHDALDVAVSLRKVLRGAYQRVRCSGTPRQQAGSQPEARLQARGERHGPRRQPVKQGSRSAARHAQPAPCVASRRARLSTAAAGARARARCCGGQGRQQAHKALRSAAFRVAHHAAQLGGALAVVRVRLEDAAAALALRANNCEASRRVSAPAAACRRCSASNAPRPISALLRHAQRAQATPAWRAGLRGP